MLKHRIGAQKYVGVSKSSSDPQRAAVNDDAHFTLTFFSSFIGHHVLMATIPLTTVKLDINVLLGCNIISNAWIRDAKDFEDPETKITSATIKENTSPGKQFGGSSTS